jgi:hypothetical protein
MLYFPNAVYDKVRNRCKDWRTGKLLLVLAITVILGYESYGTHGHILLSDGSESLQTLPLTALPWKCSRLFFGRTLLLASDCTLRGMYAFRKHLGS